MMDSLAALRMPPLIKMSRSCTPWLCVIGGETFWDCQEMIMVDYHEEGRTRNGAYNAGKLMRLCQEIARKRPGKTDSRCTALARQGPSPHVTSCHDCCD